MGREYNRVLDLGLPQIAPNPLPHKILLHPALFRSKETVVGCYGGCGTQQLRLLAQVQQIVTEGEGQDQRAVGVRLADGRVFRGRTVISNATRWDTFEKLMGGEERLPASERAFRQRYKKSPSFLSIHMGVRADALPPGQLPSLSSMKIPHITYRPLLTGQERASVGSLFFIFFLSMQGPCLVGRATGTSPKRAVCSGCAL